MPRCRTLVLACAGSLPLLATGGCTLVKPAIGAVVGPILILSEPAGGLGGGCGCDGRGVAAAFAALMAVGAAIGLVTGVVSDVQALSGAAADPTANWWHPMKTNTSD